MSKQIIFTNGLLTNISGSELSSSTDARQYTFVNGLCTNVSAILPGLSRNQVALDFINGLLVHSGSFTSGSVTPPSVHAEYIQLANTLTSYGNFTADAGFRDLGEHSFTMEGYHYFDYDHNVPPAVGDDVSIYYKTDPNFNVLLTGGWWLDFPRNSTNHQLIASILHKPGKAKVYIFDGTHADDLYLSWNHIALTSETVSGTNGANVWINGIKQTIIQENEYSITTYPGDDLVYPLMIGKHYLYFNRVYNFGWQRLSNYIRYATNFTPPDKQFPPDFDAGTLGLWKVDEGTGSILVNSEGTSSRNATVYEGTWNEY